MTPVPPRRLFVALWPDDAVRAAVVAARDRWRWSGTARPTPVRNLHATLVFLGDVSPDRVPALVDALAVPFDALQLPLGVHALWGNGIAALEPAGDWAALATLQADLAARTASLGFMAEARRYRPHVTLAREARGSKPPPHDGPVIWPVSSYGLVESRGGRYATVATWRTGASGAPIGMR